MKTGIGAAAAQVAVGARAKVYDRGNRLGSTQLLGLSAAPRFPARYGFGPPLAHDTPNEISRRQFRKRHQQRPQRDGSRPSFGWAAWGRWGWVGGGAWCRLGARVAFNGRAKPWKTKTRKNAQKTE